MNEIELKLLIDEAMAARIERSPAVLRFGAGELRTTALRTVYHDTPDRALARAGIALRTRHDGGAWRQSVKAAHAIEAGLSRAVEDEAPLAGPGPDLAAIADADLRAAIEVRLAGQPVAPVFETRIERGLRRLAIPALGEVDLALDRGEIVAGERAAPIAEVEIELVSGSPRAVFEAARHLFPEGGPRFSERTKADRGALLLETGEIAPRAEPRPARTVALEPGWTTERGARAVLGECLEQIVANIAAVRENDDPEGAHQLRVGLRRLRTALAVFRPALGGPALEGLEAGAKRLAHEAGSLRDLDVALADILGPERAEPGADPGLDRLAETVAAHAARRRAAVREALATGRVFAFQLDLGAFVAARGWLDPADWEQTARLARPVSETLAAALSERLAKAAKKARGIDHLGIEQRHDLRKALKTLRYAVEFAAPLWPEKRVKPFLKRLKALQAVFGDLQDAAMAEALFRDAEGPAGAEVAAARAAGFVVGVRTERARRAWEDAKGLWKAFEGTEPFWA